MRVSRGTWAFCSAQRPRHIYLLLLPVKRKYRFAWVRRRRLHCRPLTPLAHGHGQRVTAVADDPRTATAATDLSARRTERVQHRQRVRPTRSPARRRPLRQPAVPLTPRPQEGRCIHELAPAASQAPAGKSIPGRQMGHVVRGRHDSGMTVCMVGDVMLRR